MKKQWHLIILVSFVFFGLSSCKQPKSTIVVEKDPYYTEQHRPQFHFSPDSMWMNDPNGMVFYQNEYHLFYQHHPYSNKWGPMHWGHALSPDLVHWEHLPIALYPDSLGTIFSGSAVVDWKNSSGLGSDTQIPLLAIFTQHQPKLAETGSDRFQNQSMAYSLDRGRSWSMYPGNPVLANPGIRDFRDPKVIWYEEGQKWLMVLAAQDRIMFYSSPNLIDWNKESDFLADRPMGEGVWECPDFFPLIYEEEEKWILIVSIGSGAPNGGSGTKYYIGDFDGQHFSCESPDCPEQWIDYGKDNYAGVTWSDIPAEDGRRIFMGWMSNWQYAQEVPTERWRSAMTLPRELKLGKNGDSWYLRSIPIEELKSLRRKEYEGSTGPVTNLISSLPEEDLPGLYELEMDFRLAAMGSQALFGFYLLNPKGEKVMIGVDPVNGEIFLDRSESGDTGFSGDFPGKKRAPLPIKPGDAIRLHAFVDHSSIEVFVNDGRIVLTGIFFPGELMDQIGLYANDCQVQLEHKLIYSLSKSL